MLLKLSTQSIQTKRFFSILIGWKTNNNIRFSVMMRDATDNNSDLPKYQLISTVHWIWPTEHQMILSFIRIGFGGRKGKKLRICEKSFEFLHNTIQEHTSLLLLTDYLS
jgi:hypothetical protein